MSGLCFQGVCGATTSYAKDDNLLSLFCELQIGVIHGSCSGSPYTTSLASFQIPTARMRHFSDLPSELLCLVSRNLENEELLVFCQVSKQLHFAALTVYFDRFAGIYAPINAPAIICKPSLAALRGLLLALWVKKCHSVCCTLHNYKQLSYLIRFMSRLEPFRNLHLRFALGMEPESKYIIFELIDLMLVIKEKRCEDMLITGGHTERALVPRVTDLTRALRLESVVSTVDVSLLLLGLLPLAYHREDCWQILQEVISPPET